MSRKTTAFLSRFPQPRWKEVNRECKARNVTYRISLSLLLWSSKSLGRVAKSACSDVIRGRSTSTLFLMAMVSCGEPSVGCEPGASSRRRAWRSAQAAEMVSRRALRGLNPFLASAATSRRMTGAPRTVSLWSCSETSRCQENMCGVIKSTRTHRRRSRSIFLSYLTDALS